MKIWIDTEFNDYQGSLISIALVDAEGRTFYEAPWCNEVLTEWVRDNVSPVVGIPCTSLRLVQHKLEVWLEPYTSVHLIADWPDDIRHFCDLLITGPGKRISTPRLTMEIRRDLDGAQSAIPHNALQDAIAIKNEYLRLTQ